MKLIKLLPIATITLLTALFFSSALFHAETHFIGGIDVASYYYFLKSYAIDRLSHLSFPLWNAYYYSGHPFLANPDNFVFYPFSILFLIFDLPFAFTANTLFHIVLAGYGAYLFVNKITCSKLSGICSAIVFGFNSYMIHRIFAGHINYIQAAALFPWIMYFLEIACSTLKFKYFLLLGFAYSFLLLSGVPQTAFYISLTMIVYFIFSAFLDKQENGKLRFRKVYYFVSAIFLGVLLSAVQLLPSIEFMSLSDRAISTYSFSTHYSFPPILLLSGIFPHILPVVVKDSWWEFSTYVGISTIVLSFFSFFYWKNNKFTIIFVSLAILSITAMLGSYTPIYKFYYSFIPGFGFFRMPARANIVLIFSFAVLSGIGLKALFTVKYLMQKRVSMALIAVLFFLITIYTKNLFPKGSWHHIIVGNLLFLFLPLLLYWLCTYIPEKYYGVAKILVICFMFLDLFVNLKGSIPIINKEKIKQKNVIEEIVLQTPGLFRVAIPQGGIRGMYYKYFDVNGYQPIVIGKYYDFMHKMSDLPAPKRPRVTLRSEIFDQPREFLGKLFNVKYYYDRKSRKLVRQDHFERAFWVNHVQIEPDLEKQLSILKSGQIDLSKTALVKRQPGFVSSLRNAPAAEEEYLKFINYKNEMIEIESNSYQDRYLILSELFYPGWKATIDNHEVEVVQANYLLRSVAIPRGVHTIKFTYKPNSFYYGLFISILSLLISTVLFLWLSVKRKN